MNKKLKKLALSSETLRSLDLEQAAGGVDTETRACTVCTKPCSVCTACSPL